MSSLAGTQSRSPSTTELTRESDTESNVERPVTTRLIEPEPERWPYTKVRDWIALLSQDDLPDGAFRLYAVSRSVIWENTKGGGPPPRPVIEITYEEYGLILGRSAKTISRLAAHLYTVGLWEEVERTSRSIRIPGKARPEVRTVVTIRVHDYPRDPRAFTGPVKTWDRLAQIRETRKRGDTTSPCAPAATGDDPTGGSDVRAGQCDRTPLSVQSEQDNFPPASRPAPAAADARTPAGLSGDPVPAGQCDRTAVSAQSDQAIPDDPFGPDNDTGPSAGPSPAQTAAPAARCDRTDPSEARTDLSAELDVSAGHSTCDKALKKTGVKEEKPSLPPPSAAATLDDELAMFSTDAAELVCHLYDRAMSLPDAQPLSANDRIGLARRIDGRLKEGWSLRRVRAVVLNGSLDGVRIPARLWATRLDNMPAFPATGPALPVPREARHDQRATAARAAPPARPAGPPLRPRRPPAAHTNDCSRLPDPNAGKARYEIPDDRARRMTVVWADERTVPPWCGHCSEETRCLRARTPGALLRPCPNCHPDPGAFPAADASEPVPASPDA